MTSVNANNVCKQNDHFRRLPRWTLIEGSRLFAHREHLRFHYRNLHEHRLVNTGQTGTGMHRIESHKANWNEPMESPSVSNTANRGNNSVHFHLLHDKTNNGKKKKTMAVLWSDERMTRLHFIGLVGERHLLMVVASSDRWMLDPGVQSLSRISGNVDGVVEHRFPTCRLG